MALLVFWWMLLAWLVVVIAAVLARYFLAARRKTSDATRLPIAHSTYLTQLPEYEAALKKYRFMLRLSVALMSISLLAAMVLTARPAALSTLNPEQNNRDIMLCLDSSGSVLREDTALINRFSTLVKEFDGQRFGLVLFNSSAVSVIPINNNYELTAKQLTTLGEAFKKQEGDIFTQYTNATLEGWESGTSLVGDGITTCMQRMGANLGKRSQSIILATDNEIVGKPIIAVPQVLDIASQRKIRIYTLDPGVGDPIHTSDHEQLRLVGKTTGGKYYDLNDTSTVNSLINEISKQAPEQFVGTPQPAVNDRPLIFLIVTIFGSLGSVIVLRRLDL